MTTPAPVFNIFNALKDGKTIYTLHYMVKHKPHTGNIVAKDFNEAKDVGTKYCKKYQLLYLSVVPFFLDPDVIPLQRKLVGDDPQI